MPQEYKALGGVIANARGSDAPSLGRFEDSVILSSSREKEREAKSRMTVGSPPLELDDDDL